MRQILRACGRVHLRRLCQAPRWFDEHIPRFRNRGAPLTSLRKRAGAYRYCGRWRMITIFTYCQKHSCLTGRRWRLLPFSARLERANASEFRTHEPSASISEQQLPMGVLAFKHQRYVGINQIQRQISMRNSKLYRTIILVAAIALGWVSVTIDAFARSGVGGAGGGGVGHAAPSGGVATGHASTAPHGTTGGASHAHATDGVAIIRVGHGFVPD